jgi:iron complex transport system substrate-binding protein
MRPVLLTACVLVLLAGCGGGAAEVATERAETAQAEPSVAESAAAQASPSPSGPALPVTVTDASGAEVTVSDVGRIVSLTGSATEVVDALGLFDNLAGVDQSAIYPPEAAELPQIGYQRALAAEGILALEPTLILGTAEAGPPEVIEQLRGSGVPTVILGFDESLDTPAAKIRAIAEVLGVPEEGERVAAETERQIAEALEGAEAAGPGPRTAFVYYRGPETILLGGAGTVSETMIEAAGGVDAGAESGVQGTVPLTPEALAAAAPEVLVFPSRGLEAAGGVEGALGLPGVAQTPAGQSGRIVAIDDQALLGLGPRTGAALAELVEGLHGGSA